MLSLLVALSACNAPGHRSAPPPATGPVQVAPQSISSGAPTLPSLPAAGVPMAAPSSPLAAASASARAPSPSGQPGVVELNVPAEPRSSHHYVIAAIGDSLTDPRSHGGGYLEYLKTRCPTLEVDNFGKGATMVNQMRHSFDEQVAASTRHYTHLVIFGGVNDLYSDLTAFRTPAKIEKDLGYMYAWGKAHGVKVVALTVAPWGGFARYFNPSRGAATRTLNAWIREQPKAGNVDSVIDAYALLSCGDPESLCERYLPPFKDGIHFGPKGHEVLGQALFRDAFSDCE